MLLTKMSVLPMCNALHYEGSQKVAQSPYFSSSGLIYTKVAVSMLKMHGPFFFEIEFLVFCSI